MSKLTFMFTLLLALISGSYITMAESTIIVNTTSDELNSDGDCSLREAIEAVNTASDVDNCSVSGGSPYTIDLSAGTYTLSLAGADEDNNQTGDLDIQGDVTINGVDAESTIIDGNQLDRVLQIHSGVTVQINDLKITNGNTSGDGGGIHNEGTLTIAGSTISDNTSGYEGGGIKNYNATLTISGSTINNNTADYSGGGINNGASFDNSVATLNISNSTISSNTADNEGGGIDNSASHNNAMAELTISGSTISGNTANSSGGGINNGASFDSTMATLNISNSTISGNSANSSGGGVNHGASHDNATVELTINHSTISSNTANESGGGLYISSGFPANFKNTLIANNTLDCSGTLTSYGYNLMQDTSGCTINEVENPGTNITGQDALLGSLANNGGSTQTHALLAGSPAIDAGSCTDIAGNTVSTDQRGTSRPQGATCDIGSFELSDLSPTPVPTNTSPAASNTPTPTSTSAAATNTPVPEPSVGDAYESDDVCGQASSLGSDGTVSSHTFHTAGDVDWAQFEVISGTEYLIEARTPDESQADVALEVRGGCGGVPSFSQGHAFSPDIRLRFTAPQTGSFYLRLNNQDPNVGGDHLGYQLSVRALGSSASPGAVVIVGGRLRANDPLQDEIHKATNQAYRLFIANGYDSERIYYLATDLSLDADGDGVSDVDAQASRENLQAAITQWAVDKVGPERAFTLYLMDHGGINKLYLNGENQFVTPDDVDGWLDTLEAKAAGVRVNVIVEACHAGSFIHRTQAVGSPQSLSQPGRVVIASTGIHNLAYPSENGAFFSHALLSALGRGASLYGAFSEAQSAANQAHPDQTPWLDDDGDGVPNESEDGQQAQVRGFAYAGTLDGEEKWQPYIAQAEIGDVSDGNGLISAQVRDDGSVLGVTAIIYKPSYIAPDQDAQEMPQEKLPTVALRDADGDGTYRATYEGFDEPGAYRIVIVAVDDEGISARPKAIEMQLGGHQLYLPLVIR